MCAVHTLQVPGGTPCHYEVVKVAARSTGSGRLAFPDVTSSLRSSPKTARPLPMKFLRGTWNRGRLWVRSGSSRTTRAGSVVRLPYSPEGVAKIKTLPGRRWHPDGKYWTIPYTDGALARLLALFGGNQVEVDPALRTAGVNSDQRAPADARVCDTAPPAGLLGRAHQALRARHYSRRTEQAYLAWITRFVASHGGRAPDEMGEGEVNRFLTHLAVQGRVSASTQNQALAALLFLYDSVLHRPLGQIEGVVRARRPRRLPVVLGRQEVRAVLDGLEGTPRLVCALLYGSGLRLLECLRLRVKDIDFQRNEMTARAARTG